MTVESPDPAWWSYRAFGLGLWSQIRLPELIAAPEAPGDVTVRLGAPWPEAVHEPRVWLERDTLTLELPHARYLARGGREIMVEPAKGAAERDLRVHLLGSAMGAICHQRGLLPLHAGAIAAGAGAVALAGRSGAGKSTLAATLEARGHPVMCDDLCVVGLDDAGAPRTWPGPRRLKLWRDAIFALGRTPRDGEPIAEGHDKFSLPLRPAPLGPEPLAALYLLRRSEGEGGISRLRGVAAMEALLGVVYRADWARDMGRLGAGFEACAALARRGRVFTFDRRWDLEDLDTQAETLEDHMAASGLLAKTT